jgi:hypothetical protein
MEEKSYPVTRKEMDIIRCTCYHPYWDKCGGLNPCEYFDEDNCVCNFEVTEFMDSICERNPSNTSLL